MIILERDGSLLCHSSGDSFASSHKALVDIPSDMVRQTEPGTVIDRILDFTFNILGLHNVELRVYEDQGL